MSLRGDNPSEAADPAGESDCCSWMGMSPWTVSRAKRVMDICIALALMPVAVPLLLVTALAVLISSGTPVIFRQKRMGRYGEAFSIYKFRTMRHASDRHKSALAADSADRVTALGFLLRRTKLDELPQVLNVLAGDMSL